jgi:hypothetical protein
MFKLVGFYPNAVGGDMALEVNLEGQGAAERTGLLTASRFVVLGDNITVNTDAVPGARPKRKGTSANETREKIEFNTLRAPFEVGHGQFVLKDASIVGPLVSANMRGKIDFRSRRLVVGGTFTPLSALNKVPIIHELPFFGDLLTGQRRDGVFAWAYALHGNIDNPQLLVHPLSGILPGIFRDLVPMVPDDPQVVPGSPKRSGVRGGEGAGPRSSSSTASGPDGDADGEAPEPAKAARRKKQP